MALVAVPLEMLLDSGRHVMGSLGVIVLRSLGALAGGASHVARHATGLLSSLYDVYVAIPLRIESMVTGEPYEPPGRSRRGGKDVPSGSHPTEGLA